MTFQYLTVSCIPASGHVYNRTRYDTGNHSDSEAFNYLPLVQNILLQLEIDMFNVMRVGGYPVVVGLQSEYW